MILTSKRDMEKTLFNRSVMSTLLNNLKVEIIDNFNVKKLFFDIFMC